MTIKANKQVTELVRDKSYHETLQRLKDAQKKVMDVFLSTDAYKTSFDVAAQLNKPINEVTGRIFELVALGLIEPVGKTKSLQTGRTRTVYRRVGVIIESNQVLDFSVEESEWYKTMEAVK